MRALAFVVLMRSCGCGDSVPDVEPLSTMDYVTLDVSMMADATTYGRPMFDYFEYTTPSAAAVSPAELADVWLEEGTYIVIHPAATTAPAFGTLHVTLAGGTQFERPISIAARARTDVVPDGVPPDVFAGGGVGLAVFVGAELVVKAEHYDAAGSPLLGHRDDEMWSGDNVVLVPLDDTYGSRDRRRLRRVRTVELGPARVSISGASLPFDVVAPGTTARLALDVQALSISRGQWRTVTLRAFASDGRFIYGGPPTIPIVATSSDPGIVAVEYIGGPERSVHLRAGGVGTANLTFELDGQTLQVPVTCTDG